MRRIRHPMDAKDFRLLVVLNQDARQSFRALGRHVGLSAPAVRERLNRLAARGILQGYWVSIDPAIFGRRDLLLSFGGEFDRDEAANLLTAPDIAWVAWKVDGGVTVQVWPLSVAPAVAALSRFVDRKPVWRGVARSRWSGALSGLDWRVLDALIDEPLAPVERLAEATGLSPKTVRAHLQGLTRSEAIYVVARLGSLGDSGELVYDLLVSGSVAFVQVRRVMGDAVLIHETERPPRKYLFCRADSLADLTAKSHALERLAGVTSVKVTVNREMLVGRGFVHQLVAARMEERRGARP